MKTYSVCSNSFLLKPSILKNPNYNHFDSVNHNILHNRSNFYTVYSATARPSCLFNGGRCNKECTIFFTRIYIVVISSYLLSSAKLSFQILFICYTWDYIPNARQYMSKFCKIRKEVFMRIDTRKKSP